MKIKILNSGKLELIKPIKVAIEYIEKDKQYFIYTDVQKLNYAWGIGKTKKDAIKDFCRDIEDIYFDLKGKKLGKFMQKVWDYMKIIIKEK